MKELFLVEGKSAHSTIRQAMDIQSQDVFALQGKIMNTENVSMERIEANPVCAALFETLGCGIGPQCTPSRLLYSRIILLTDPDVDGAHARALLAVLFMKFLRPLIEDCRVFAVIPPLWRVASRDVETVYAWTDEELAQLRGGANGGQSDDHDSVTRFRGVAQFSREECVRLMLDPDTRRQVLLSVGER